MSFFPNAPFIWLVNLSPERFRRGRRRSFPPSNMYENVFSEGKIETLHPWNGKHSGLRDLLCANLLENCPLSMLDLWSASGCWRGGQFNDRLELSAPLPFRLWLLLALLSAVVASVVIHFITVKSFHDSSISVHK